MAVTSYEADLQPWWPEIESLPARAELDYDPVTDSLLVAFDPTRPAEHFYLDTGAHGYLALRLALDTAEVVGIVIEDLNTVALSRHPSWQRLVEIAGTRSFKRAEPADYSAIAAFIADVLAIART
ncbi:MAG: hypothetical protein ACRDJH_20570 [Thermomicrobiales bacterium]